MRGATCRPPDRNSDTLSRLLLEWAATGIAGGLGFTLVLAALLTDFDLIKLNLKILDGLEMHQVDDVLVG